jgi:hypothetical protein
MAKEMRINDVRHRLSNLGVEYDSKLDKDELIPLLALHDVIYFHLEKPHIHCRLGRIEGNITNKVRNALIKENAIWSSRITERRKSDDK